mmetsp:Transcript_25862/g.82288  ORF Transcript_25862/g.82288 Transcript_25862/m.82288 type:complete len:384 (+) Transcript_25862:119-1270(+)
MAAANMAGGKSLVARPGGAEKKAKGAGHEVSFVFDQAEFRSCHASTILPLEDGGALLAWFGGHREGDDGVVIWGARRGASGTCGAPYVLASAGPEPHWNPVLFRAAEDSSIKLFFKYGRVIATWRTYWASSTDEGASFSSPVELVPGPAGEGGRGPSKNKVLALAGGGWVAGSSDERGAWYAFADVSEDAGRTWKMSGKVGGGKGAPECIQPSLWESKAGHVHMLLRSDCGYICRSDSEDGGRTWGPLEKTVLPNNNSGVDVCKLADGRLLLAYNPTSGSWAPRSPLRLSLSSDNGGTWPLSLDVAEGAGEYSYPAVVATGGGGAVLSFTWQRSRIAVASLFAADLQAEGAGGVFSPTPGTEGPGATPTYSLDFFVNTVGERA